MHGNKQTLKSLIEREQQSEKEKKASVEYRANYRSLKEGKK